MLAAGRRFRIARAGQVVRTGPEGPEPPRATDATRPEGMQGEAFIGDADVDTDAGSALLEAELRDWQSKAGTLPPEIIADEQRAREVYPSVVLLTPQFAVAELAGGGGSRSRSMRMTRRARPVRASSAISGWPRQPGRSPEMRFVPPTPAWQTHWSAASLTTSAPPGVGSGSRGSSATFGWAPTALSRPGTPTSIPPAASSLETSCHPARFVTAKRLGSGGVDGPMLGSGWITRMPRARSCPFAVRAKLRTCEDTGTGRRDVSARRCPSSRQS